MRVGSLILGLLGGAIVLFYGLLGYGLGGLAQSAGHQFMSIAIPVAALVGAGMVMAKPAIGAGLMAASAVGVLLVLDFGFFTFIPVILLGIAAVLGFSGVQEIAKSQPQGQ